MRGDRAICCGQSTASVADHAGCVGPGWRSLLGKLDIELRAVDPDYEVLEVKEKFGWLRVYLWSSTEEAQEIVSRFEQVSSLICEDCGDVGACDTTMTGWIKTLCMNCRNARNVRYCRS